MGESEVNTAAPPPLGRARGGPAGWGDAQILDGASRSHGELLGYIVPLPLPSESDIHPEPVNVTACGEKGFLQMLLRILRRGYSGLGCARNPRTSVHLRRER